MVQGPLSDLEAYQGQKTAGERGACACCSGTLHDFKTGQGRTAPSTHNEASKTVSVGPAKGLPRQFISSSPLPSRFQTLVKSESMSLAIEPMSCPMRL